MKSGCGDCGRWKAGGYEKIYMVCYYSCKLEDTLEQHSTKHEELSEELTTWWRMQTEFKTKKALAGFLKVHPDTVGEYFSGRTFPRSDIADRLGGLTNIGCLKHDFDSDLSSEMVPHPEVIARQLPRELPQEGWRYGERSVVISFQRASCPFCKHDITRFRRCAYCGQYFVWANVPLESEKSK
jgi:hypothetical protein